MVLHLYSRQQEAREREGYKHCVRELARETYVARIPVVGRCGAARQD